MGAITHNGEVLQGLPGIASQVNYDNSDSGLSATQVQDAIDEVNEKIDTLGTASTKDVPVSGNASTSQVVMGNDTRLSDARPASDVSAWAKASTKPSYTASEVGAIANNSAATLQAIELTPNSGSGHGGYIDFHYNGSSADNTSRIIEAESGNITINGVSITGLANGLANINNALLSPISNANKIAMSDAYMSLHDIGVNNYDFATLTAESHVTWFTNWTDNTNFPVKYGSGVLIPGKDTNQKSIIYTAIGLNGGTVYTNNYNYGTWVGWRQLSFGPIFVGTLVLTPQVEGRLNIPFSTVGVSVRPSSVFVTMQSKQGFATYDFDSSTNNYIEIIAFEREYEAGVGKNTFIPIKANEPIRICIMVYA